MDEPYSSLDEPGMNLMNQFIKNVTQQGTTVLMTTHNRSKTAEVAHRAGSLFQGQFKNLEIQELVGANELF